MSGTLYLLPCPIAAGPLDAVLPAEVIAIARRLDYFLAEQAKSARAFLKDVGHPRPIRELSIVEIGHAPRMEDIDKWLAPLASGTDAAIVSEAGCPGIADPGGTIVAAAHARGLRVRPLVGPSSILLALMGAGLDGQRFRFHGYLPVAADARAAALKTLERESKTRAETQVSIETPYRSAVLFDALLGACAPSTRLAVAADLTGAGVLFFGRKDNFWEMAETGPCGPCSEIHIDRGPKYCDKQNIPGHICTVNGDCARFLELWNLVFIQYNRISPTQLEPLPAKHVDTGMGLERIVSVLQDVDSNYKTDLLSPMMDAVQKLTGHSDAQRSADLTPYRVIADHSSAAAFLIVDGVVPGNIGRNYVCRMIIRRAARFGSKIGLDEPFLATIAQAVIDSDPCARRWSADRAPKRKSDMADNPRGNERRPRPRPPLGLPGSPRRNRPVRHLAFWLVLFMVLLLSFQHYYYGKPRQEEISYSQFLAEVRDGNIRKLTFIEKQIDGELLREKTLTEGPGARGVRNFRTSIPFEDPDLLKNIAASNPDAVVDAKRPQANWLGILASGLPFLLLIVFWLFLMRQMQGGGNRACN